MRWIVAGLLVIVSFAFLQLISSVPASEVQILVLVIPATVWLTTSYIAGRR